MKKERKKKTRRTERERGDERSVEKREGMEGKRGRERERVVVDGRWWWHRGEVKKKNTATIPLLLALGVLSKSRGTKRTRGRRTGANGEREGKKEKKRPPSALFETVRRGERRRRSPPKAR